MEAREIPHRDWPGLCSRLTKAHGHSPVIVRVSTPRNQRELVGRPLADLSTRNTADGETILIAVGDCWDGYVGHTVANPQRVRLLESQGREIETLVIEGADGSTTVVDFYPAD